MKKIIPALLCALIQGVLFGQSIDTKVLEGLKIRSIGPAGMSGRVTAITADPERDAVLYIGTASGGVWRSEDAGTTWSPIFDEMPTQSIGCIAVHPSNPDVIWVGTGEGNPRNSQSFGAGLYKSIDRGKTWKLVGLEKSRAIHRILLHRDNPDIAWAGVLGSTYGPNVDRGVFKTTDGGKNWSKPLYINDLTGCAELVQDPQNPNKLFAAMWEYERKPYHFTSGGKGSGIYVSFDAGETWTKRTDKDGLPEGDLGRCGLAIAPSNPMVVYALVEAKENALYKSTDGGANFQKMADKEQGNRPFYYAEIYVHPTDENTIYSIHSTMTYSIDGGKSFQEFAGWTIHPDHHAFWIHPRNPSFMIDGNDGGMNISLDGGGSWRFVDNLPVGQFYHVNVDNEMPYNVYGGMQDNGSWVGPSSVWRAGGILNSDWQEVLFGDGFDVMPNPSNPRYLYAMYQGGNLYYIDRETGQNLYIKPNAPENVRYNWNAALAQDPFSSNGVYYGSQYLHYSSDCGQNWTVLSSDLTTNDTSKLHQDSSGGLTIDATNAENYCTIVSIAPSSLEKGLVWVGTDDGNLQITRDGGKNWTNCTSKLPNFPKNGWIPQITVSETRASEAFVIVNNYRQNDWKPYVYRTTDYGTTWTRLADERQVHTFCHSIIQDSEVPDLLFLGTDGGLYFSLNHGKNWQKWPDKGFPSTPVSDLKIQKRDADLVIGTFGRALWVLDDLTALRALARNSTAFLNQGLAILQSDTAYLAEYSSYRGSHFPANTEFNGASARPTANFVVWKKADQDKTKDEKDKKKAKKKKDTDDDDEMDSNSSDKDDNKDEAKIWVLNQQGDTLKTIKITLDSGFNRISWGLDTKGVFMPSKKEPKKDAEPWGGPDVLPGVYKVVIDESGLRDSTTIVVKDDPRLNRTLANMEAKNATLARLNASIQMATDGYNRLKKAEKTIKAVESQFETAPDSLKKEITDLAKISKDSIRILKAFFFEHEELKGIQRNPKQLNARFWEARAYINNSPAAPASNAEIPLLEAERETAVILKRIDTFFESDWSKFQKAAEAVSYSPFDDLKE